MKPEPVAWAWVVNSGAGYISQGVGFDKTDIPFATHVPLYTTPPQREWTDLTAAEIKILRRAANNDKEFAALLVARFKEKNNG